MLIVFEGYNCTGKSTLSTLLDNYFHDKKYFVDRVAEPYTDGHPLIQDAVESISNISVPPAIQTGLFKACHELHVEDMQGMENCDKLFSRTIYLCSRYTYSNYAYNNMKIDEIIQPDLIFYLELDDFEFAVQRSRSGNRDLLEEMYLKPYTKSYDTYKNETFPQIIKRYEEIIKDAEDRGLNVVRMKAKEYSKQEMFEKALRHIENHELFKTLPLRS